MVVAPIVYLVQKSSTTPYQETLFFHLLLVNLFCSVLFWSTVGSPSFPPYSMIHHIDGWFAKVSGVSISVYVLFHKSFYQKISYGVVLALILYFFWMSHLYSTQDWASQNHLYYHRWLHVFGSLGTCWTFL
jgi:hypothetical protein